MHVEGSDIPPSINSNLGVVLDLTISILDRVFLLLEL